MGCPGHGASFGACVVHLSPQGRTVSRHFPDGDDLLPVQSDEGVKLLDRLQTREAEVSPLSVCPFACLPVTHLMQTHSSPWLRDQPQFLPSVNFPSTLTIRLPSTSPSVLSRRSGPLCATLIGKMIPTDLGRFFRPYGAEHMHSPAPEAGPTQTNPLLGSPGSDDGSVLTVKKNRAAGRTEHQQTRLHPSGEESPSAPPGGTQGGFSVFFPSRDPTHTRSKGERGFRRTPGTERLYRTPKSCSASNTARHIYGYNMWPLHNVTSRGVSRTLSWGRGRSHISRRVNYTLIQRDLNKRLS